MRRQHRITDARFWTQCGYLMLKVGLRKSLPKTRDSAVACALLYIHLIKPQAPIGGAGNGSSPLQQRTHACSARVRWRRLVGQSTTAGASG